MQDSTTTLVRLLLDNWIVTVVLIFFTAWLLGSIVEEIGKCARHRRDAELKRDLAERGLSVDEIERLVAANSAGARKETVVTGDLA